MEKRSRLLTKDVWRHPPPTPTPPARFHPEVAGFPEQHSAHAQYEKPPQAFPISKAFLCS